MYNQFHCKTNIKLPNKREILPIPFRYPIQASKKWLSVTLFALFICRKLKHISLISTALSKTVQNFGCNKNKLF